MRMLFVLRGRPGLGHVIPGLALAQKAIHRGHQALIVTYGNGVSFLDQSSEIKTRSIDISNDYLDWPGLSLYDHGVRVIAPIAEKFDADLLIMGGEYLLAPLQDVVNRPCVMLFNPEIMEDNFRNLIPSRLFIALFKHCRYLAPMQPLHVKKYFKEFLSLKDRFLPEGPYVPKMDHCTYSERGTDKLILIANGGGISFPSSTQSYSSDGSDPEQWIEETQRMTRKAVEIALHVLEGCGRIAVYSCLGEKWNNQLFEELGSPDNLEIQSPSMCYYKTLVEADLVISRAGGGFIADVQSIAANVVLWCLTGHDEQKVNAQRLCSTRSNTFIAHDEHQLEGLVADSLRQDVRSKERLSSVVGDNQNSMLVMQSLEQAIMA